MTKSLRFGSSPPPEGLDFERFFFSISRLSPWASPLGRSPLDPLSEPWSSRLSTGPLSPAPRKESAGKVTIVDAASRAFRCLRSAPFYFARLLTVSA